ncbi:SGNH/GDSL hydrolase family protein [Polaribacter sp.]|uniref:SGNH/GDSL hydrolase family protein n=1 Tax=Polaribacter sp. TaxID=1920175 RepID=UPI003F6B942B
MNRFLKISILSIILLVTTAFVIYPVKDKIRILLMGDSTTIGGKYILEKSISSLLMAEKGMPEVEVINVGRGGDTAYEFIQSGRYKEVTKDLEDIDYIFFRYGINDYNPGKAHRKNRPFKKFFKSEVEDAIKMVKKDFKNSKIIMMNIISWRGEEKDGLTNRIIEEVAKEQNLDFFDIYTPYEKMEEKLGENSLRVRFIPLSDLPKRYHQVLKPFTKFVQWKKTDMVRLETKEFDAVFNNIPDWYKDRHPNNAGYRLIAEETVDYLIQLIKK